MVPIIVKNSSNNARIIIEIFVDWQTSGLRACDILYNKGIFTDCSKVHNYQLMYFCLLPVVNDTGRQISPAVPLLLMSSMTPRSANVSVNLEK